MTTAAEKLARTLTPAQKRAVAGAVELEWRGRTELVLRLSVRMDVRARLQELGLAGRRVGHPLTKIGREVRAILRGEP